MQEANITVDENKNLQDHELPAIGYPIRLLSQLQVTIMKYGHNNITTRNKWDELVSEYRIIKREHNTVTDLKKESQKKDLAKIYQPVINTKRFQLLQHIKEFSTTIKKLQIVYSITEPIHITTRSKSTKKIKKWQKTYSKRKQSHAETQSKFLKTTKKLNKVYQKIKPLHIKTRSQTKE